MALHRIGVIAVACVLASGASSAEPMAPDAGERAAGVARGNDPTIGVEVYLGDLTPPATPPIAIDGREVQDLPVPADLPPSASTWLGGLAPLSRARIDGR